VTGENQVLLAKRTAHVPRGNFNLTPYFAARAKGAEIWDVEGKRYLDFAGGIGAINIGHCNEEVVAAIKDQSELFIHTCFSVFMYDPYVELARRLNGLTPGRFSKKTIFVNSGAEAVENAVKVARYSTGRPAVVVFEDGFHGRTLLAMTMTSKVIPYKFGFGPFAPEVYRMPYAYCYRCTFGLSYPECDMECAHYLENFFINQAAAEQVAALIVEPVLGEGGFIAPPFEYFSIVSDLCKKNGIVFIADEIQSGICRTGKLFAMEHYGVEPDLITIGKSLAAGLPLTAVTGRSEIMDASREGSLGGTFGGNPISCRAALAVLDFVNEAELISRAAIIGQVIRERFLQMQERYSIIGDVRGLGAMMGMEMVKDRKTKEPASVETKKLITTCLERGLVLMSCGRYGNVIRTLMPLVITDDQLDEGLHIIEEALAEL
jgi:4-aminobutyrate aminotransferase / (S)-3-amino-2-methylpropionate transaminase / 5-aminovalerate transaminase